jgi:hypothetical protein
MDQPVDEHTQSDLAEIANTRQLSTAQCKVLARNVTGALRPNRDFFLWVLVNVLSAAFQCAPRQKPSDPVGCALEIVLAGNAERRQLLARYCAGRDGIRVTADGITVDLGVKFEANWARIDHALAFGDFFIMGHDGALYGSFEEAVKTLFNAPDPATGLDAAVSILSRRVGQWRRDKLPLGRYERHFTELIAFLGSRQPQGERKRALLAFDDDDIVAFWRKRVDTDDRLMFRTVVERFRDIERLVTQLSAVKNLGAPADLDALVARVDLDLEAGDGWHETEDDHAEDRLLEALDNLPADPKALKGTEADSIKSLVSLLPFPKQRPGTMLRVLAFTPVQSGIANRLRRKSGGAEVEERVACGDANSYEMIAGEFDELLDHLERLLRIAAALRFGDAASAPDADAEIAEMIQQRADIIQQGNTDLKRMRRAGFDRPREELAAVFAQIDGVLGELRDVVQGFTKEIERIGRHEALCDRFAKDKPVFIEILTRAYIAQLETES